MKNEIVYSRKEVELECSTSAWAGLVAGLLAGGGIALFVAVNWVLGIMVAAVAAFVMVVAVGVYEELDVSDKRHRAPEARATAEDCSKT